MVTLAHDFWSNYPDPNGFMLGEYRDPGHLDILALKKIHYEQINPFLIKILDNC